MISGANGEEIAEPDDIDKEIAILQSKLKKHRDTIEIAKSPEAVSSLVGSILPPLLDAFFSTTKKFQSFYFDTKQRLVLMNYSITQPDTDKYQFECKQTDNPSLHKIIIGNTFTHFNKAYSANLYEYEIKKIVDATVQAHLKFIKQITGEAGT